MQSRFKPKFWKDINKVKKDKELMSAIYKIFMNVEKAESEDEINNIKQMEKFDSRFRIKLSLDKKRDYILGLCTSMAKQFGLPDSFTEKRSTKRIGEVS